MRIVLPRRAIQSYKNGIAIMRDRRSAMEARKRPTKRQQAAWRKAIKPWLDQQTVLVRAPKCQGGCGGPAIQMAESKEDPLSYCSPCWYLHQTLQKEKVRDVRALIRKAKGTPNPF